MRSGHSVWATIRQTSDVTNIQGLLEQYSESTEREFTVQSQLRPPTGQPIADREVQGPSHLKSMMGI